MALLRELGYGLRFRTAGWCEVLVWRESERWLGAGPGRREALEDALARIFPSAAAREALRERRIDAPADSAPPSRPELAAPAPAPPLEPAEVTPSHAQVRAVLSPIPAGSHAPGPSVTAQRPVPRPSPAELGLLRESLVDLDSTIRELFVEVLGYSASRMRLCILAWAAQARAAQTESGFDPSIEASVAGIFGQLTQLSRLGWPGNVPALALQASPRDCAELLGITEVSGLRTWTAVLDLAEERIAHDEVQPDLDADGWWREDPQAPAPPAPQAMLRRISSALESWGGPLPDLPAIATGRASIEAAPKVLHFAFGDSERAELLKIARQLRWLRSAGIAGWECAFGRVRWVADRTRSNLAPGLATALDARCGPHRSWALECGHDPKAGARSLKRRELLRGIDLVAWDDPSAALDWLTAAFELGAELNNEKLAELLSGRAAQILALSVDALADRAKRKRLRRLKELLEGDPSLFPAPDAREPIEVEEAGAEDPAPESSSIPPEVLSFTRGKRTLIVGNRADRELDRALSEQFGFSGLDRCDLAPNRVESHAERIERGSYDLVLASTGFMSHKSEHALRKACRSANVLLVRVNKGRPAACARHIARELGIRSEALEDIP